MIYIHENTIHYYGECDTNRKILLVSAHLTMWRAKLGNKYWKKELIDNVKKKIEIHTLELERLKNVK